jgi:APA family basic amino acid/polyamine antiporter
VQDERVAGRSAVTESTRADTGFVRGLGLFDSTMIVAGVMIGSGFFIVPGVMSRLI